MSIPPDERLPTSRVLSHLGVMAIVAVVMGVVVAGLAIPFAGLVGIAARDVSRTMDDLPTELTVEPLAQKTRIVDGAGNTIANLYDENRINVSLGQVSRTMVKSIVAIEDYRYYEHGALDLKGTLRALVTNQASGGVVQGGSSITQQMVKLTLVSQADTKAERAAATEESFARKIRELRYAIAFEEQYSKDWILERYLNLAYFGDGAFGIQSAARHYFDKNAADLDLAESALLAGIVKNPSELDPTNSPDAAIERRNVVLDRMAQLNVISEKKAEKTKRTKIDLDLQPSDNGCVNSRAPFFCDYVVNYLMKDPSLGKSREARKQMLRTGGLTIRTTIDLRYQDAADQAVRDNVNPTDSAIGGLAMVEPGTGEVKALAQSRPMGGNKELGQTFLNYVVPQEYGDSNGFQPGSTFKVFVLAQALAQGVPPDYSLSVPAQEFIPESEFGQEDCPYQSTGVWDPVNFDASGGTYDLYSGTQNSVNTFFANLELITGLCKPYELAKDMGIVLTNPSGERVPSFTLGRLRREPAGDVRGLRDLRRARPALRVAPDHRDRGHAGQPAQGLPRALHPGPGGGRRRHRQRHPQGRPRARRLRPEHHHRPGGRRQDRDHPGRQGGVVRRLHPQPGHRRDDRRRQQRGRADPAHRASASAAAPSTRPRAPASPDRCGARRWA